MFTLLRLHALLWWAGTNSSLSTAVWGNSRRALEKLSSLLTGRARENLGPSSQTAAGFGEKGGGARPLGSRLYPVRVCGVRGSSWRSVSDKPGSGKPGLGPGAGSRNWLVSRKPRLIFEKKLTPCAGEDEVDVA
jgi:hypothetical protein